MLCVAASVQSIEQSGGRVFAKRPGKLVKARQRVLLELAKWGVVETHDWQFIRHVESDALSLAESLQGRKIVPAKQSLRPIARERCKALVQLVRDGYGHRLLLSQDVGHKH